MKINTLSGIGNAIAIYPDLVPLIGSHNATIFFCQLCYWHGKGKLDDNWMFKTQEEWQFETALTPKEQLAARKQLKARNLIEERKGGIPARLYYRVNAKALLELWDSWMFFSAAKRELQGLISSGRGQTKRAETLRTAVYKVIASPDKVKSVLAPLRIKVDAPEKKPKSESEAISKFSNYQDFLKSDYWGEVRSQVLHRDSNVCQQCGAKTNLQVHHLSYDHHGDELNHLDDLTTLCRVCHSKVHGIGGKKK